MKIVYFQRNNDGFTKSPFCEQIDFLAFFHDFDLILASFSELLALIFLTFSASIF